MSMAKPGPHDAAPGVDHDLDDLVGFSTARSLAHSAVRESVDPPEVEITSESESEPEQGPKPEPEASPVFALEGEPEREVAAPVSERPVATRDEPEPELDLGLAPIPSATPILPVIEPGARPGWREQVRQAEIAITPPQDFGKTTARILGRQQARPIEGIMGLFAVYALILFAVPTLGVSAAIALLAVFGREGPTDPVARSHFIYQQRTLYAAAVTALLGVILIVIGLGVFVLFVLAVWTLARGAWGVWRLKADLPIDNPRNWLF